MKLEYQADFLESAIGICAAGKRKGIPSILITRFNFERERIYRQPDPDAREHAFQQLHLKWFLEWGLESSLLRHTQALEAHAAQIESLLYRKARSRKDEAAELYANDAGVRRVAIALRGERFEDDDALGVFLRHESQHICDMLDPAFGYEPSLLQAGATATQVRLATERYRVLWDAAIDGRLARAGRPIETPRAKHEYLIHHAFAFWPEQRRRDLAEQMWTGRDITHRILAAYASDPRADDARPAAPGQPCPLCGMPTFEWADAKALAPVETLIRQEFPRWTLAQSACARCAEVYAAMSASPEAAAALRDLRREEPPALQS